MIFVLLFVLAVLEGSFISLPFIFLFLLFLSLKNRTSWVFAVAFIAGILLDAFYLRTLGQTSIFFLLFLFAVMLYEKKFEIENLSFVVVVSFIGSFIYFSFFANTFVIQKALFTSLIAFLLSKYLSKESLKLW